MGSELRETIIVCVELILFALLIIIIAFFGRYSQSAFVAKSIQDDTMNDILEYRNMYEFTGGAEISLDDLESLSVSRTTSGTYKNLSNSKILSIYQKIKENKSLTMNDIPPFFILTGDDIVRFIGLFGTECDVVVANLDNSDYSTIVFSVDERFKSQSGNSTTKLIRLNEDKARGYMEAHTLLNSEITDEFYCFAVYDNYYYKYDSIVFFKKA